MASYVSARLLPSIESDVAAVNASPRVQRVISDYLAVDVPTPSTSPLRVRRRRAKILRFVRQCSRVEWHLDRDCHEDRINDRDRRLAYNLEREVAYLWRGQRTRLLDDLWTIASLIRHVRGFVPAYVDRERFPYYYDEKPVIWYT